jgi:hypothetical protein
MESNRPNQILTRTRQPESLLEFFARSPLAEVELDLSREDYGRDIALPQLANQ